MYHRFMSLHAIPGGPGGGSPPPRSPVSGMPATSQARGWLFGMNYVIRNENGPFFPNDPFPVENDSFLAGNGSFGKKKEYLSFQIA